MKPKLEVFLHIGQPHLSFHDGLQQFLSNRRRKGLSEYSITHLYNSLWPLGEALKNPALTTITPRHLKDYNDALWLKYAPGTVRPIVGDIKQYFRWCKKKRLITGNPAKRLAKPRPRRSKKDKAAPETAVAQVIRHLGGKLERVIYRDLFGQLHHEAAETWKESEILALRDLFVVVFLYETGARASEMVKLGAAMMVKACGEGGGAYCVTSTGKTADRDMRFTRATAELWRVWYAVRPQNTPADAYAIFSLQPTRPAAPLTSNGVSQILVRRCKEAETAVFRSHSLRHAKVRRARRLFGLEMASLLIDHSSVEMTRNYANVDESEVNEAVRKTGLPFDLFKKPGAKTGE